MLMLISMETRECGRGGFERKRWKFWHRSRQGQTRPEQQIRTLFAIVQNYTKVWIFGASCLLKTTKRQESDATLSNDGECLILYGMQHRQRPDFLTFAVFFAERSYICKEGHICSERYVPSWPRPVPSLTSSAILFPSTAHDIRYCTRDTRGRETDQTQRV